MPEWSELTVLYADTSQGYVMAVTGRRDPMHIGC